MSTGSAFQPGLTRTQLCDQQPRYKPWHSITVKSITVSGPLASQQLGRQVNVFLCLLLMFHHAFNKALTSLAAVPTVGATTTTPTRW